ncbi:MAG TPA: TIGR03000 domain-containing protein [Gemmataceae bacterium]|nr:TIGR03000 domain-containing protein [Gemmataceae bacterium]
MFSQGSSLLCRTLIVPAVLILGWSTSPSAQAQPPVPTGGAQSYNEPGPVVPEAYQAGGGQQRTNTGQSAERPVFTPGYFEVVCPAICYGGAFHVFGARAYGGPGYYGPFRRYWAYSTYGPNFNIGPDNAVQYGQRGCGVIYEAQRSCKGLRKHGTDCCKISCLTAGHGSAAGAYGPVAQASLMAGGSQQPAGNVPSPTTNPAPTGNAPSPTTNPAPTPNTARLQLLVPENAEVLVEGNKTAATGTVRHFVSPPLDPGKNMLYAVTVRYKDADGKPIEETHSVRVRANDDLRIDCTPQPAAQARASGVASAPRETPSGR